LWSNGIHFWTFRKVPWRLGIRWTLPTRYLNSWRVLALCWWILHTDSRWMVCLRMVWIWWVRRRVPWVLRGYYCWRLLGPMGHGSRWILFVRRRLLDSVLLLGNDHDRNYSWLLRLGYWYWHLKRMGLMDYHRRIQYHNNYNNDHHDHH
jgi:hypothetical protein